MLSVVYSVKTKKQLEQRSDIIMS